MLELDALTKWCPFTRAGNEAGCNRNTGSLTECIGPKCMMWVTADDMRAPDTGEYLRCGDCGLKHQVP